MKTGINKDYMFDGNTGFNYVNRQDYNLEDFKRKLSDVEVLIVHCTATDSEAWDNPLACIRYDLSPNHISRKGCPFATYHFYVNKQGVVYQLVSMNYYTWNVAGHNRNSVAICINHGAERDNVSKQQYKSLVDGICYVFDVMDWSYDIHGVMEHLKFHRDYNPNKTCPGKLDYGKLCADVSSRLQEWGDIL
ncbi:MAG: N-acetylmuramoyl-L-alanine amidase [Ignavibacteria bacterium]|nr:N-acetylmuramoyl-L-alanine amidase [Ignavibacteria bacterium]